MNALSILSFVLCPQYSVNFVPNLVVLLDRIIIGGGHVAWRRNINRIRLIRIDISSLNSSGLCSFGISRWHTRRNCKSTSSSCIGSISRITINSWMKENSTTIGFVRGLASSLSLGAVLLSIVMEFFRIFLLLFWSWNLSHSNFLSLQCVTPFLAKQDKFQLVLCTYKMAS